MEIINISFDSSNINKLWWYIHMMEYSKYIKDPVSIKTSGYEGNSQYNVK